METKTHSMSAKNRDSMIWMRNREWYYIDDEHDRFVLTTKAPEEAQRSFEKWKRINNLDWNDKPVTM